MSLKNYHNCCRIGIILLTDDLRILAKNKAATLCIGSLRKNSSIKKYCSNCDVKKIISLLNSDDVASFLSLESAKTNYSVLAIKHGGFFWMFLYPINTLHLCGLNPSYISRVLINRSYHILEVFNSDKLSLSFRESVFEVKHLLEISRYISSSSRKNVSVNGAVDEFVACLSRLDSELAGRFVFANPTVKLARVRYLNYPLFMTCMCEFLSLSSLLSRDKRLEVSVYADDTSTKIELLIDHPIDTSELDGGIEFAKLALNLLCKLFEIRKTPDGRIEIRCEIAYSSAENMMLKQRIPDIYYHRFFEYLCKYINFFAENDKSSHIV